MTNEIYIVCGTKKYLVTEQVIKAMQNTGRLEQQPSEDCVSRQIIHSFKNKINDYGKDYTFSQEEILNILERYEIKASLHL